MKQISLSIDDDTRHKAEVMAEAQGASISSMVRILLRNQYKLFEQNQQVLRQQ